MTVSALLLSLGVSLTLTLAIELSFALAVKIRGRALLTVLLVNVVTNPVVVLVTFTLEHSAGAPQWLVQAPLEIAAVLTEGAVYKSFGFRRPFLFSLAANALSLGIGCLIGIIQRIVKG